MGRLDDKLCPVSIGKGFRPRPARGMLVAPVQNMFDAPTHAQRLAALVPDRRQRWSAAVNNSGCQHCQQRSTMLPVNARTPLILRLHCFRYRKY